MLTDMVSQNHPATSTRVGPERRRNSRVSSRPYQRDRPASVRTTSHTPGPPWEYYPQGDQHREPSGDRDLSSYSDFQSSTAISPNASLVGQHSNSEVEAPEAVSYFQPDALFPERPGLHQFTNFVNANSFQLPLSSVYPSRSSGDYFTPSDTGPVNTPISGSQYDTFDGPSWSTPNTVASDISPWGSPPDHNYELADQNLSDDYFLHAEQHFPPMDSPEYSYKPTYDTGQMPRASEWNNWVGYGEPEQEASNLHNSSENISPLSDLYNPPWYPENVDYRNQVTDAYVGNMAIAPRRGLPYRAYRERERILRPSSQASQLIGSEGSLFSENTNSEPWKNSPREVTPSTSDGESVQENIGSHCHIFSAEDGVIVPTSQLKEPRKLTVEQRRKISKVRKDGACWPCHLLKIGCSPCEPGLPCEKCASLMGKRRFCKLACFNDPIETLYPFLMPDLLVGHLTEKNVREFVAEHASGWGVHTLDVRMSWGSQRLLTASVVPLFPKNEMSEVGFLNQAVANGTASPTLVRQKSPPLGIPLPLMVELQRKYQRHVQEVIQMDLAHYPSVAYGSPASKLSECLLRAICIWYQSGVATGDKCALVEGGLEAHVIETILERSLILDPTSLESVQALLGQDFPRRSAPRFAQRQIKLALAMLQKLRAVRVMEQWGKLMYNMTDSNDKWATAYCGFLLLTLLMDQLITGAYYMCEDKIKFRGGDAPTEKRKFHELARLMETELFERCKEIFHTRYKTRKGVSERFNPVRDGMAAWRNWQPDARTVRLVNDMQTIRRDFGHEIRQARGNAYTNLGRLTSVFLRDLLGDLLE